MVLASCCPPRCVDREPAASTSIAKTLNPVQTASFFVNACLSTLIGRPLLLRRYPREFRMKKGKEKRGKGEEKERKRGLVKRFSWSNVYIAAARSKASLAPWTATSGVLRRWRRGRKGVPFAPPRSSSSLRGHRSRSRYSFRSALFNDRRTTCNELSRRTN